jgi:hypothetical protein
MPKINRPPSRAAHVVCGLILPLFLALCALNGAALPLLEGADEGEHSMQADYIAAQRALPDLNTTRPSHQSAQPPLYHLLVAIVFSQFDRSDLPSLMRRNINTQTEPNRYLHARDEASNSSGAARAIRAGRLLSSLMGCVTLLCAWRIGRALLADAAARGWARLPAESGAAFVTSLVAFNPKFVHMHSVINNDVGVTMFSALAIAWLLAGWRAPNGWRAALLGALIACALLCKLSGLALLAPALVWVLCVARRSRAASLFGGLALGIALLAGPWLARNTVLYGDPLGWTQVRLANAYLARPVALSATEAACAGLMTVMTTFHLARGFGNLFATSLPYLVWLSVPAALLVYRVGAALRHNRMRLHELLASPHAALAAWVLAFVMLFVPWMLGYIGAENGRLLLPLLAVATPYVVIGWHNALDRSGLRRWTRPAAFGVAAAALLISAAYPSLIIAPVFNLPGGPA